MLYRWLASWSGMLGVAPLVIQVGLVSWVLFLWFFSGGSNMLGVAPVVIQVGLGYSGGCNMLGFAPLVIEWT